MFGPGQQLPAPQPRPTHIRRHGFPPQVVHPPEWAWVHGIEVRSPQRREEKPS